MIRMLFIPNQKQKILDMFFNDGLCGIGEVSFEAVEKSLNNK